MAAEAEVGALPKTGDGRENKEPESRAGRSGSEPSIEEIDILLPGRWP